MTATQIYALIGLTLAAALLINLGYFFGRKDGKAKGLQEGKKSPKQKPPRPSANCGRPFNSSGLITSTWPSTAKGSKPARPSGARNATSCWTSPTS